MYLLFVVLNENYSEDQRHHFNVLKEYANVLENQFICHRANFQESFSHI